MSLTYSLTFLLTFLSPLNWMWSFHKDTTCPKPFQVESHFFLLHSKHFKAKKQAEYSSYYFHSQANFYPSPHPHIDTQKSENIGFEVLIIVTNNHYPFPFFVDLIF